MKVSQIIAEATQSGRTRFAFELLPPLKGGGAEPLYSCIEALLPFDPAYINITCHREAICQSVRSDGSVALHTERRRPGTVGISAAIEHRYGISAVPHLICAGESKYSLEDQLIDMDFLGLENLLVLRGDPMPGESVFRPESDGYLHAVDLVHQVAAMNCGHLLGGEASHRTSFSIGVAGYPETHSEAAGAGEDIARLKEKVDAGAEYVITQLFYDNSLFFDFVERCRKAGIGVPIIPGIKPMVSLRQLERLPATFGCRIPKRLESDMRACADDAAAVRRVGLKWCAAQCRELIGAGVPVLHFFPYGKADSVSEVLREIF